MNRVLTWAADHLLLSVVIASLILLLPLFIYWLAVFGKTTVEIVAAPSNATITINGEKGRNGINRLSPGEYMINASHEGFETYTEVIIVSKEHLELPIFLEPVTDEAYQLLIDDSDRFLEAEGLIGEQIQKEGEELRNRYPIIKHLPHKGLIFSIDYTFRDGALVLIVSAGNETDREYARAQIRNWGFNPSDFIIEYRN